MYGRVLWLALLIFAAFPCYPASQRMPWKRREGVVLYRMKENPTLAQKSAFTKLLGARLMMAIGRHRARSHDVLAVGTGSQSEEDLAEALQKTGAVAYAEPDYLMPAAAMPNDPGYPSQWFHLKIHSPSAWDVTSGLEAVTVAVCDTGVDSSHPDLKENLQLPGFNVVNQSTDTEPVADHGTAVAGLVGAVGNNGLGVAGMAWKVRILPVRITNNPDTTAWCSDMAQGIEWAADQGAKVINLSYDTTGCPNTIDAAAQYAKDQGALVVIASGNESRDLTGVYPETHAFVMVGATDSSDHRAGFSNYGSPVDLVAPGVTIYTTEPGGTYRYWSGTSMATPLVSGTAVLIYSLSPTLTPDQVRNILLTSSEDLGAAGKDSQFGFGRLDAANAVYSASGKPLPVALPAPVLNLPSVLSLHSRITAGYPAGYSITGFEWAVHPSESSFPTQGSREAGIAIARWTTPDSSADLNTVSLRPGPYAISVRALDRTGVASPETWAWVSLVESDIEKVRVYPNPWRSDRHHIPAITFDRLAANSTVQIFSVSGHHLKTLSKTSEAAAWDLTNESGETVASGLYLYLVSNDQGQQTRGKLAIIR
jgi:subtilisin family serine protease